MSELSDSERDEIANLLAGAMMMSSHIKDILGENRKITEKIQAHFQSRNFQEALDAANYGINFIEDAMDNNPTDKEYLGPSLVEHIAWKGNILYTQAIAAGTSKDTKKELLNLALVNLDKALSFPKEYYLSSKFRSQLEDKRKAIKEAQSDCFIATAAYGSVFAPEITILRQFRDTKLRRHSLGQTFIRIYETTSPPLADWIRQHNKVRTAVRYWFLAPMISILRKWLL